MHQCVSRDAVAHKTRQFEDWLEDTLENFRRHQETLISRMPRIVRNITMREFAKYKGDIQAAVKGLSRELLGSEDATIDLTTRKRKWVESQEVEGKDDSARNIKNGRGHPNILAWLVLIVVKLVQWPLRPRRSLSLVSYHSRHRNHVFR